MLVKEPVDPARRMDRVSAAEAGDEGLFLSDGVALVRAQALHANRERRWALKLNSKPSNEAFLK